MSNFDDNGDMMSSQVAGQTVAAGGFNLTLETPQDGIPNNGQQPFNIIHNQSSFAGKNTTRNTSLKSPLNHVLNTIGMKED